MPITAALCPSQDQSCLPLKKNDLDLNLSLQKHGDPGDHMPGSPPPPINIGRTNTIVNSRHLGTSVEY